MTCCICIRGEGARSSVIEEDAAPRLTHHCRQPISALPLRVARVGRLGQRGRPLEVLPAAPQTIAAYLAARTEAGAGPLRQAVAGRLGWARPRDGVTPGVLP